MARLWLKIIRGHRISEQLAETCTVGNERETLTEMCKQLDLPTPIWLNKHVNEYESFRRTSFTAGHFIEEIDFERMEIEFLDDTGKKRKSDDPRNQF